jgi:hypothetical protein
LDIAPVGSIPTNNKQNRKSEKPKIKKKNFSKMFVINKKNHFRVITFKMLDIESRDLKNKEK